jgi:hypothetical protein
MPRRNQLVLSLFAATLTAGCAHQSTAPEHPPFEGTITEGTATLPASPERAQILVAVEPPARTDAAWLHILPSTEIVVRQADGSEKAGNVHDLVVGARYRAWHTGGAMRSLPPQFIVTRIEVW